MTKKEQYQKVLEKLKAKTLTDTVSFKLTNSKPTIFESKVGGVPYVPKERELPQSGEGNQLRLLAQIDCKNLASLPDFPHKGLLQFFVSDDDICGLGEENGSAVIYYENVDETVTEEECKAKLKPTDEPDENYFPVDGEYGIEFTPEKMSMTMQDFRYEDLARDMLEEELGEDEEIDEDLFDLIFWEDEDADYEDEDEDEDENDDEDDEDDEEGGQHRIGGYPWFTQFDPRSEDDILLFQLDSDGDEDGNDTVLWGDCGICNFFISQEDLKNRDFSKVLYNWDCC